MASKGQVIFDRAARTLFVVFEDYDICVGIGEEGPDEVFADDTLKQGERLARAREKYADHAS